MHLGLSHTLPTFPTLLLLCIILQVVLLYIVASLLPPCRPIPRPIPSLTDPFVAVLL